MCAILEYILNDETCLAKFLHSVEQKQILCNLTMLSIESDSVVRLLLLSRIYGNL
jgi:hypothetical protein